MNVHITLKIGGRMGAILAGRTGTDKESTHSYTPGDKYDYGTFFISILFISILNYFSLAY